MANGPFPFGCERSRVPADDDAGQLEVVDNDAGGLDFTNYIGGFAVTVDMDRRQVQALVDVLSGWLEVTATSV